MGSRAAWACALVLFAVPARAEDTPVRIEYSASAGCPDEREFVDRVSERLQRARFAEPGEMARTFRVTIRSKPERSVGRVEFVDTDGGKVSRTIGADTCDEVVNAIALVTALAMEARAGGREPEPTSRPVPSPAPTAAPPARAPAKPSALTLHETRSGHLDVGAGFDVASAYAPAPSIGLRAFVEYAPSSFSIRATAMHSDSGTVDVDGGQIRMQLWGGRLEGCPLAWPISDRVSLLPCAGFDAGALDGEGLPGNRIAHPKHATELWLAGVLIGRLVLALDRFFLLEAQADARFPFLRHEFFLEQPERVVHTVPAVGFGASVGVGFRFE